jgi:uncharacterized OB-fold protein
MGSGGAAPERDGMSALERGFLTPSIDDEGRPFWEGAAVGELRVQACASCDRLRFPPRPMCPRCRSLESDWRPLSGRGTVWSFIVPHPPLLAELADVGRFNIAVVALEEDETIRLVGNVVAARDAALDSIDPGALAVGLPVAAAFL